MDKAKEILEDPSKLEPFLKEIFDKVDAGKKGYLTHEEVVLALDEQAKIFKLPKPEKEPSEEDKKAAQKITDPDGTGKVLFENFVKLIKGEMEKAKAEGKFKPQ